MGNFYKSLDIGKDVVATRTLLHEAIPLTGTIVSGTYGTDNIKNYAHGMFQSVYDYPYLSSSANHIFDITVGVGSNSALTVANQPSKKLNIYNQMAQVLVGYDHTGSVQQFDEDGDILAGGTKLNDIVFLNFARLLTKDEIKKGSFTLTIGANAAYATPFSKTFHITDASGSDGYLVNSPVGEYGILFASQGASTPLHSSGVDAKCGLLFYQAGVCALTASIFHNNGAGGLLTAECEMNSAAEDIEAVLTGSNIEALGDAFRHRIHNLQFNNTVELNSSVYFCRVNHNEFNYSTNPTYLSGSKIRVKTQSSDLPVSYITSVGLYNDNNELLASAKLSEPLKKSSDNEFTLRVRLDY
tara:strand:- start:827 stop:1894 length:1068 start_codon:yes stop_codon:yes gene_type:complete